MKNHYRSIVFDLTRKRDADPKAIQLIEFVGQLKGLYANDNATDADSIINNHKLSKIRSWDNKYTIKTIKISAQDEELPYKLFLTTRQTTKIRSSFASNMSTDIKLSKAQISKIVQSHESFGSFLAKVGKRSPSKCCYFFS